MWTEKPKMIQNMNIKRHISFQNFSIIQWQDFAFVLCFLAPEFQRVAARNLFLREENLDGYSILPNKSAGCNKSAGWNIYQKLIKVQAEIIMQVGIFFKT